MSFSELQKPSNSGDKFMINSKIIKNRTKRKIRKIS